MFDRLTRALALAALALTPLAGLATPVIYAFTGHVESDDADRGYLAFAGSFRFDSATPDAVADPLTGAYLHAGAPWGLTLAFDGGAPFTLSAAFAVLVSNDLPGGDQWGLLAQDAAQAVSLTLYDFSGTRLTSDALPLPPGGLTLADFGWSTLRWESADGALQGRLATLACTAGCAALVPPPSPPPAVPEPGTLALTLGGLAAARLVRRRAG